MGVTQPRQTRCYFLWWVTMTTMSVAAVADNATFEFFVSKQGIDSESCGAISSPCGSLYHVSLLAQRMENETISIEVTDGQNATQIEHYKQLQNTNNSDPCLPVAFGESLNIIVTFDYDRITQQDDWLPRSVCGACAYNNSEYMFDGGKSLTLHNLIVGNYTCGVNGYGLIRSSYFNASVTCVHCTFTHIETHSPRPLIYTMSSIRLSSNLFEDVYTASDVIYATHHIHNDESPRIVHIEDTLFNSIVSSSSLLHTTSSQNDQKSIDYGRKLHDICEAYVEGISFMLSFSQMRTDDAEQENGFFYFTESDHVYLDNIDLDYTYDVRALCYFAATLVNSVVNQTYQRMYCQSPPTALLNVGQMSITNMRVDMRIEGMSDANVSTSFIYDLSDTLSSLILNKATMSIDNMVVKQTICQNLIHNTGTLSIAHLSVNPLLKGGYNPNHLESRILIYQTGNEFSALRVSDSYLYGGYFQIYQVGGALSVYDCVLEHASRPIYSDWASQVEIARVTVRNVGQFNGRILSDEVRNAYQTAPIQVWDSSATHIMIRESAFHGYDPWGLLYMSRANNISLINNTFNINTEHFYYNASADFIAYGVVSLRSNTNTTVIGNRFEENAVSAWTPWLNYYRGDGVNCLTGNAFTNYAFFAYFTNLTSCYRPTLIDVDHAAANCTHQSTMRLQPALVSSTNDFVIKAPAFADRIFDAFYSHIYLDNVRISGANHTIPVFINGGALLLMDAVIDIAVANDSDSAAQTPADFAYDSNACVNICNQRLANQTNVISKLLLDCAGATSRNFTPDGKWYYVNYSSMGTLSSPNLGFVDHLRITKLNFAPISETYYPGQLLQFKYEFSDMER